MLSADQLRNTNESSWQTNQSIGDVVSVHGSQVTIGLLGQSSGDKVRPTVGKFLGIRAGGSLLVGVATKVSMEAHLQAREHGYQSTAELDLVGEIRQSAAGSAFQRGVT